MAAFNVCIQYQLAGHLWGLLHGWFDLIPSAGLHFGSSTCYTPSDGGEALMSTSDLRGCSLLSLLGEWWLTKRWPQLTAVETARSFWKLVKDALHFLPITPPTGHCLGGHKILQFVEHSSSPWLWEVRFSPCPACGGSMHNACLAIQ